MPPAETTPPAVRHGLIEARAYDKWRDLMLEPRDRDEGIVFIRDLCRDNLLLFDHIFIPRKRQVLPHIIDVYGRLKALDSAVITVPRGHSKSESMVIAKCIHDICYACVDGPDSPFYDPRLLLAQETAPAARSTMNSIRLIIETGGQGGLIEAAFKVKRGGEDLPIHLAASTWDTHIIVVPEAGSVGKNATLMAVGTGSSTQGLHPKTALWDDVVTPNNSRTATGRAGVREWFLKTIYGTRDPGSIHWSFRTPLYAEDLNEELVKDGGYTDIRSPPALNRDPTLADFEPILDEIGNRKWVKLTEQGLELQALWPCPLGTGNCPGTPQHYQEVGLHRSVEWLIHDKFLRNPVAFTSDYMLRLLSDDDRRFKPEMMRFFSRNKDMVGKPALKWNPNVVIQAFPENEHIVDVVHSWDHAFGKKRHHDETAGARLYRSADKKVFSITTSNRWDVNKALRTILSLFQTEKNFSGHRPRKLVMEGIGFQKDRSDFLQDLAGELLPIEIITSPVDKDTALAASGLIEAMMNGQFFLEYEDDDTVNQFLMFTPDGKYHDDRVDANRLGFVFIRAGVRQPVRVLRAGRRHRRD